MNRLSKGFAVLGPGMLLIAGCAVKEITPSVAAGDGILVDTTKGKVSIDQTRVPLVDTCDTGQVIGRTSAGWACMAAGANPDSTLGTIQTTGPLTGGGPLKGGGTLTLGLATAPAGSVLGSTGSGWAPVSVAGLGAVGATTAPVTVYVRPDGNDTTCDGSANAPSTAAPQCAFASPQKAMDALPPVIMHPVTIALSAGSYSALPDHTSVLNIQKMFLSPTANITLGGIGAITLSATSVAYGIRITGGGASPNGAHFITLSNITVTGASEANIDVRGASVAFSGVVVQNSANVGLRCDQHASCAATGALTATGNTHHGVEVFNGSVLSVDPSATLAISASGWAGLSVDLNGVLDSSGTLRSTGNGDTGMTIGRHSSATFNGDTTVSGNQADGIAVQQESDLTFNGTLSVTVPASHSAILAMKQSSIAINASNSTTLTCTGWGSSAGLFVWQGSRADVIGSGSVSISGCEFGIWQAFHSSLSASGGPRSISGARVAAYIANLAYYQRGNFPASTSCVGGAICE